MVLVSFSFYAMNVTFQQTNLPIDTRARRKNVFSVKTQTPWLYKSDGLFSNVLSSY